MSWPRSWGFSSSRSSVGVSTTRIAEESSSSATQLLESTLERWAAAKKALFDTLEASGGWLRWNLFGEGMCTEPRGRGSPGGTRRVAPYTDEQINNLLAQHFAGSEVVLASPLCEDDDAVTSGSTWSAGTVRSARSARAPPGPHKVLRRTPSTNQQMRRQREGLQRT